MSILGNLLGGRGREETPQPARAQPPRPAAPAKPAPPPAAAAESRPTPARSENQPRHRAAQSSKVQQATPEQVARLMAFKGEVLTAPGAPAELTEAQSTYVALIAPEGAGPDGCYLIVSRDYSMHHETSGARSILRRKGHVWARELHVDLEVIQALYEGASQRMPTVEARPTRGTTQTDTAQMQREFLGLVQKAAEVGSSDIHIIVKRSGAQVRIRADGVMMKLQDMTASTALDLCQAAFAMADASDTTYMPMEYQGARVNESSLRGTALRFPSGVQAVRLQFNPLPAGGRYMVARLLYAQKAGSESDVDELGYAPNQIAQIKDMRRKPFGIVIISGPTGSGKSTTLQRGLTALMREKPGINVLTIEDPPEYVIEGAAQLPVTNAKTAEERSEKFRQAITASLRSDPDVIMIGEIRDGASAHLAFEAAMTGHGVWASLHANDAVSILDRLRDQTVEPYKLCDASLMIGLIGQRLVRRTRQEGSVGFEEGVRLGMVDARTASVIRDLAGDRLDAIRFAGTHQYDEGERNKAFSGRTVVAETILPDQQFLDYVRTDQKAKAVAYWIENLDGMTMLEHAVVKCLKGEIDPREVEDKIGLFKDVSPERVLKALELVERE